MMMMMMIDDDDDRDDDDDDDVMVIMMMVMMMVMMMIEMMMISRVGSTTTTTCAPTFDRVLLHKDPPDGQHTAGQLFLLWVDRYHGLIGRLVGTQGQETQHRSRCMPTHPIYLPTYLSTYTYLPTYLQPTYLYNQPIYQPYLSCDHPHRGVACLPQRVPAAICLLQGSLGYAREGGVQVDRHVEYS